MRKAAVLAIGVFNTIVVLEASKLLYNEVTEEEKKEIVDVHNEYRLRVANGKVDKQPKATNMKQLCWDDALAREAQRIADKMLFEHEKVTDARWHHVGQNLAQSSSTAHEKVTKWRSSITRWFDEVKLYEFGSPFHSKTGHYTQLIWAKTSRIGCGFADFEDPSTKFKYKKLYVCNYGPGGNIRGVLPYRTDRCGCIGLCKQRCTPCTTTKKTPKKN